MKRVETIPSWFNVENYQNCSGLSLSDWYRQLYYRFDALLNLEFDNSLEASADVIREIRRIGLPDTAWHERHSPPPEETFLSDEAKQTRRKYNHYRDLKFGPVSPLSHQWMAVAGGVTSEHFMELLKEENNERVGSIMCGEPWDIFAQEKEKLEARAHVVLDMTQPDTEIIEQFKKFLPEYRKFLGLEPVKKKPTDATLQKLVTYKILAFLDLYIWELENNIKIKRSVMALTLYPDGLVGDMGITQTVEPYALDVASEPFLRMLESKLK